MSAVTGPRPAFRSRGSRRLIALSLPMLSLAACGDGAGGDGTDTVSGQATTAHEESAPAMPAPVAALPADLDGSTVRRLGLVRFDVGRPEVDSFLMDIEEEDDDAVTTSLDIPQGDVTHVEASFTALDAPLNQAELAQIAATASGAQGCYPIADHDRFVGAPPDPHGSPIFAGEVLTVSRTSGSWLELWGLDDASEGFPYAMRGESSVQFGFELVDLGADGDVQPGTTLDIPGSTFPAFAAVEIPPVASLSNVTESGRGVRWQAGTDPDMPVVIEVRFHDYLTLTPSTEGEGGDLGGVFTSEGYHAIESLVEAPVDMRCVTRDTGRFEYPDELRTTIDGFRAAGLAVSSRLLPGSDLETGDGTGLGVDGNGAGSSDADVLEATQGAFVGVSRVATRYEIKGDSLLIVQSSAGGAPQR